MKVWLDDERPAPEGWVRTRWPDEVIALLQQGAVDEVSLDHDLGDDARGTGYDVIVWLEEAVATRGFTPPRLRVHSANTAARRRMLQGVAAIERLRASDHQPQDTDIIEDSNPDPISTEGRRRSAGPSASGAAMPDPLRIVHLGEVPYLEALELQQRLHAARLEGHIGDHVLLLTHPHTLTAGTRSGKPDRWANLQRPRAELEAQGVALVEADRGGDVTWHGPGQLVIYPIIDLGGYRRDVGHYVWKLEEVSLRTLEALGVGAARREGFPGVWIGDEKIAAIGARVRRWVTMHGTALNLRGALAGFDWIVPCGLEGKGVTSVERQLPGGAPDDGLLLGLVASALASVFDREVTHAPLPDLP